MEVSAQIHCETYGTIQYLVAMGAGGEVKAQKRSNLVWETWNYINRLLDKRLLPRPIVRHAAIIWRLKPAEDSGHCAQLLKRTSAKEQMTLTKLFMSTTMHATSSSCLGYW